MNIHIVLFGATCLASGLVRLRGDHWPLIPEEDWVYGHYSPTINQVTIPFGFLFGQGLLIGKYSPQLTRVQMTSWRKSWNYMKKIKSDNPRLLSDPRTENKWYSLKTTHMWYYFITSTVVLTQSTRPSCVTCSVGVGTKNHLSSCSIIKNHCWFSSSFGTRGGWLSSMRIKMMWPWVELLRWWYDLAPQSINRRHSFSCVPKTPLIPAPSSPHGTECEAEHFTCTQNTSYLSNWT